jgi:hypothetical protein
MTPHCFNLRYRTVILALTGSLGLACIGRAASVADDDKDLPESLRAGYVDPIVGPPHNANYARGELGLVRSSFGRASLYVAWRVTQLPPSALAQESHERKASWVDRQPADAPANDEIQDWLKARSAIVSQPPAVAPDYFRSSQLDLGNGRSLPTASGQCGPGSFVLATKTLRGLQTEATLSDAHRRTWVTGQDAVFARCSATPGGTVPTPLPAAPPASAPAKLKALHAYQRAAALFYGDEFAAARKEFDAISTVPNHPMRSWAVLGALRSIVRETVLDAEWSAAVNDAWTRRGLRDADFRAAVADPSARRRARVDAALKEFETRTSAALADASLTSLHASITYTARRAYMQLLPELPLQDAMKALDNPKHNPYTMGALDLFQDLYPRLASDRPEGAMAAALRKHEWFDFIVAVQACSDLPGAPGPQACNTEHAHALSRWQATRHNSWLLATLMTAKQSDPLDLPAAEAALAVGKDRPEWFSLQFHAARVLRALGRTAEARTTLNALAATKGLHKRDRALVENELRKS